MDDCKKRKNSQKSERTVSARTAPSLLGGDVDVAVAMERAIGGATAINVAFIGMKGGHGISRGIPMGIRPVIEVAGVAKKPALVADQWVTRVLVGLTVSFDHDVTDEAPVDRFIAHLQEVMESGYALAGAR